MDVERAEKTKKRSSPRQKSRGRRLRLWLGFSLVEKLRVILINTRRFSASIPSQIRRRDAERNLQGVLAKSHTHGAGALAAELLRRFGHMQVK